jgi:hypothetical protein
MRIACPTRQTAPSRPLAGAAPFSRPEDTRPRRSEGRSPRPARRSPAQTGTVALLQHASGPGVDAFLIATRCQTNSGLSRCKQRIATRSNRNKIATFENRFAAPGRRVSAREASDSVAALPCFPRYPYICTPNQINRRDVPAGSGLREGPGKEVLWKRKPRPL